MIRERVNWSFYTEALVYRLQATAAQSLTSLHRDQNGLSGMLTDTCMPWSDNEENNDWLSETVSDRYQMFAGNWNRAEFQNILSINQLLTSPRRERNVLST